MKYYITVLKSYSDDYKSISSDDVQIKIYNDFDEFKTKELERYRSYIEDYCPDYDNDAKDCTDNEILYHRKIMKKVNRKKMKLEDFEQLFKNPCFRGSYIDFRYGYGVSELITESENFECMKEIIERVNGLISRIN